MKNNMFNKENSTPLKIGSLFDGIGVFPLSASRFGIDPTWASEIEKAPISITKPLS
ncbi:DNA cytosine methyltransferase [Ornithinibacillus massiliensis]|uniref:DNA cytosine methyltransferase n=1 Tax=Ornithinibacillus massiliensis TaxID=1944633 RepID=UPI001FEAE9D8|nr:DNA cytosine methyltransferase [Ornithinibacillus massiliensis]